MATPYCNNLAKDDVIVHAETRRVGKVAHNPEETSRMVGIVWQGTKSVQYVDILLLRYVVNGRPEDVPPCDGTPPELEGYPAQRPRARPVETNALEALKKERDDANTEMVRLEARFRELRSNKDRLERAIGVLTAPAT